jgi:DNA-binding CsgD family transcriptional regulator
VTDKSRSIVGRESELSFVHDFILSISERATALAVEGEEGVGKTTLWTAGIEDANKRGSLILEARPAERETRLSFSGIGDLLDPVLDEALRRLPPAQRSALSQALVLVDEEAPLPNPRTVGLAILNSLRGLAADRALLVAVDDLQWLDEDSAGALIYAARRLREEHVGLLFSCRTPGGNALLVELRRSLPRERLHEVVVCPLGAGALHRVIQDETGIVLPRPVLAEVHEAAGGNPLYAIEIVRMLQRTGASVEPGQPLPVPESLQELVRGRVLELPQESRNYLLTAAALSHPTLSLIEATTGVRREAGLVPALDARIVELDGNRISFTHPLLAAAAYRAASPVRRAEVHARLAELVDDPEARARHLAASVADPDESVAAALEAAADRAQARGATRAAALLLERACELTPAGERDDARRRSVDAASLHFESGDSRRAERQLRQVISELGPGANRARALVRLGRVRSYESQAEATELYLQAIDEGGGDEAILAVAHEGVASNLFRLRERLHDAVEHAELAAELALGLGDEALAAEALATRALPETLLGLETAASTIERALALQDAAQDRRVLAQPLFTAAVHWWWTDALVPARKAFLEMLQRSHDLGDESSLPYVLNLLGHVECTLGMLESAHARALEGRDLSEQSGQQMVLAYHLALEGLVEAQRGQTESARSAAVKALEFVSKTGGRPAELVATAALGHLELALGEPEAAAQRLEPIVVLVRAEGHGEPAAIRFVIDEIEALIELGRIESATALLDWHEGNARRLERASALASCARCRGLLAAQAGSLDAAAAAYQDALDWHRKVDLPLDRGRTLLALGALQRRAKRRRDARVTLNEAVDLFDQIGAALWGKRARTELRRISGRASSAGALTPVEKRVATLVAQGKTNQEIAAVLFLSKRTIEGHLSHIYGKLSVRSRSELTRKLLSGADVL